MAKKESTFVNMVGSLLVITLVSGAILGFVHAKTKEAIEVSGMKAQTEAISNVLPVYSDLGKTIKVLPSGMTDSVEIFPAFKDGHLVGIAVKTWSEKGFSGLISVMAGMDALGNVTGYEILEHKETPGLGSKMITWFRNKEKPGQNVIGKNFSTTKFQVKKDGGDIDAITASTITSRAFLDALNRAHDAVLIFQADSTSLSNNWK